MSAPELLQLRVAAKRPAAQGIVELTLEPLPGQSLPAFTAGSHLDLHLPGGLVRPYSLSNDPAETHRYVLGVLREETSRGGSAAVHDALQVGQTLAASQPRNHFALQPTPAPKLLLAGGIGITPVLSMARQLVREGRPFQLIYAGRSRERMAFIDELGTGALAAHTRVHAADAQGPLDLGALLDAQPQGTELYVCGPLGFMDAVFEAATQRGWDAARLYRELFGAAPVAAPEGGDSAFEIEIAGSGQIVPVPVGCTAAKALQDAGLPLYTSCEQGVCGTCLTRVLSGTPDHRDQYLTPEEQAANDQFLPCCSRARCARLVVEL
ncbi:PDR/VanB family oxidoreductase [Paracidovorax wautersii]|uniref:PDR/VanB family oxidoreductase n=1 Tax=Paracidovorax wautersii TaxID=1177982 RepID=UPI0031D4E986